MIQTVVIAIPGLLALIVCIRRGPERAFLNVYMPVLLLLPQLYYWQISGQLSFADTAILPIGLVFLFQQRRKMPWNSIDLLVVAYVTITVVAEGMNKGYKLGSQNLALQYFCSIFLPYFVSKQIFRRQELGFEVAKRVALCLTIVAVISIYEFRMGRDPFTRFFEGIFPPLSNTTVFRAGFMRTQGPYGHALTLGIVMVVGFRIARWLEWRGVWNEPMGFLRISKIRFCQFWIAAGSIMALSVGPLLGAACGAIAILICRAQNRKRAIVSLILITALVGVPIYSAFKAYVSVDPAVAQRGDDRFQEDSAYRNKLVPLYIPVVEERPTWGWGRNGFPVQNGMLSIDNGYLFTALTFGIYALGVQVALYLWSPIRLGMFSGPLRRTDPRALAAFTLIGIYVLLTVVNGTVLVGGGPVERFFYVITGWCAALLNEKAPHVAVTQTARSGARTQLGFRRVMA